MANELITRAYWTKMGDPTMKSVLVSLCDQANDEGYCWPCIVTICERTEWSERCVQSKLRELEKQQYIKTRQRNDRSSQYIINVDKLAKERPANWSRSKATGPWEEAQGKQHEMTGAPDAPDLFGTGAPPAGTGAGGAGTGAGGAPRTIIEPSLEPSLNIGEDFATNADMVDWVANRWNEFATANPSVSKIRLPISDERRDLIIRRTQSTAKGQPKKAFWEEFFSHCERSRFLRGLIPPTGKYRKPFNLKLSWALAPAKFNEIMDGQYDRTDETSATQRRGSAMDAADRFASRVDAGGLRRD